MTDTPKLPENGKAICPGAPTPKPKLFKRALLALATLAALPHLYLLALAALPPPVTLNQLLDPRPLQRDWTPLARISPHLVHAVIAAEDSRFCEHSGIDWDATREQLAREDGPARGASTLTQQTAKNLFFWNGGGYPRKAGEAWFALLGDRIWGKRRTLELYLNTAEWGGGTWGAEVAAQHYFDTPAAELTPLQAARLAAVLPSPNIWSADAPGPYVQRRTATLQARAEVIRTQGYADCVED